MYYSIYGINGLGVMSNWYKILYSQQYFQAVHYKKFNNFFDAAEYSIIGFKARIYNTKFNNCMVPEYLELDKLIFAKNLPINIDVGKDLVRMPIRQSMISTIIKRKKIG